MILKSVTLINNTPRAIPIVLNYSAFLKRKYGFRVVAEPHVVEGRDGSRRQRIVKKRIPGSITLFAYGVLENLDPAILGCTQVRTLEKQGRITVRREEVAETRKPTPRRSKCSRGVPEPSTEQPKETDTEENNQ